MKKQLKPIEYREYLRKLGLTNKEIISAMKQAYKHSEYKNTIDQFLNF